MIEELFEKYNDSVIKNIDAKNLKSIINFLYEKKCDYISDIIEDYLDLFTIDYEEFVNIFNKLDVKYEGRFIELARSDLNYLEEFFNNN